MPGFCLAAEVCGSVGSRCRRAHHALAGATVIASLSASDETIGKTDYRRALVCQQSARLLCTYLYADAGHGESTTDMVFAAHDLICENGARCWRKQKPFGPGCACGARPRPHGQRALPQHDVPARERGIRDGRVPPAAAGGAAHAARLADAVRPGRRCRPRQRCELILAMQADGLAKRIAHAHAKTAVIGISGGLDSSRLRCSWPCARCSGSAARHRTCWP